MSAGPGKVALEYVTVSSGFAKALGKALGILCADFDGDGWPEHIRRGRRRAESALYQPAEAPLKKRGCVARACLQRHEALTAGNMGIALNDANHDGTL